MFAIVLLMIKRWHCVAIILLLAACSQSSSDAAGPELCSDEWNRYVESVISTGDGMGHGPDIGSAEWQSVVEFKLGVRGDEHVPARTAPAWCEFIALQIQADVDD